MGDIDLNTLISHSQKDEPVHHFNNKSFSDREQEKDEPVHHFNNKPFSDKEQEKDEPVHHFEDVFFYGGKQYLLNDVQVLEENNGYTVFKIIALQT